MESQVTVPDNPSNGFRRGKNRTDGGRNATSSGTRQKWIPTESSNSRADGVKKGQDAGVKTFGEKTGKKPSVTYSDSQESSRAWSKVHNIDAKPNQPPSTDGNSSNTSNAGIAGGGNARKAAEQSFVAYLPQDDVVMEAFETQEVIDLLNKQLSALLRLPYRLFWEKVSSDDSLSVFLDSYLQYRKRWFDIPMESSSSPEVNIVVGDGDLSRRVFMVLLRLSYGYLPSAAIVGPVEIVWSGRYSFPCVWGIKDNFIAEGQRVEIAVFAILV
ncbi:hypothetical protein R1sor_022827 [Riccia sorocarpa]|uniref:Uncharacterized protein n=1 Tax=Riccia sorocarpa TaxID=122646 RepID=A0ABD3GPW3_9MARC